MDIDPLAPQNLPQTSYVIEKELYFITDFSLHGKRRAGLHKMNLETKLIEYVPRSDMEQHEDRVRAIEYGGASSQYTLLKVTHSGISKTMCSPQTRLSSAIQSVRVTTSNMLKQ